MSGPIEGHRVEFKRRTLKVPLYSGDWQQRINQALAAVQYAEQKYLDAAKRENSPGAPMRLMHEQPESETLKVEHQQRIAEHDLLVAEADADGKIIVTLEALPRRRWLALVEKHPPRTDESVPADKRKGDAELGVNDDALGEDLVPQSIIEVDPTVSVDDLLDNVSSAQWDLLYGAAFALNRDVGTAPKALSSHSPNSDAT